MSKMRAQMYSRYSFTDEEIKHALLEWLTEHRGVTTADTSLVNFCAVCPEKPGPHQYVLSIEERHNG